MVALQFQNWQTAPIPLVSVFLTDDNIYDVARWMGCGKVEISEVIGKPKTIKFYAEREAENTRASDRWALTARVDVGQYVMQKQDHYNEWSEKVETVYFPVDRTDIHKYEPRNKVNVNLVTVVSPPYDR
jgi:hypothetical protein